MENLIADRFLGSKAAYDDRYIVVQYGELQSIESSVYQHIELVNLGALNLET